jgi:DNA-directed RNA polymerase specialized sigma24 family protein
VSERLAALPREAERQACTLARRGYAVGEIATRLGRSEGAVRALLSRAQRALRASLGASRRS